MAIGDETSNHGAHDLVRDARMQRVGPRRFNSGLSLNSAPRRSGIQGQALERQTG